MRRLLLRFPFLPLIIGCTPPPPPAMDAVPALCAPLSQSDDGREVRAAGRAVICIDGEKHSGSAEIVRHAQGRFRADFYAPFGFSAASVVSDGERATVEFDGRTYSVGLGQSMDSLPFSWGGALSMENFIALLAGRVPNGFSATTRRPPDTLLDAGRRAIIAVWKTDSVRISIWIRRRSGSCESIVLECTRAVSPWRITMSNFEEGRAHKIELNENENNYFSINYSKVVVR